MTIEETKSYQGMSKITQMIISKSTSKKQILGAVKIAKTIGLEKWEKIADIPQSWISIVKELAS